MKKLIASCIAAMTVASGAVLAQDKPVEMKLAHWVPAAHPLQKTFFEPWAKSLEQASKGTIKVALFPAQQLGKAPDHYDMARDGIADMAWVNPGYQAGRFPIFEGSELPFLMSSPGGGSGAIDAWYRKHAAAEMKDVLFCLAHLHIGALHSKAAITSPAQIKGMKIRPANGNVARLVTTLGGTNVQLSAPEARDALEKGVADAITFPWNSIITFGIDKVTKFHTDVRLYQASFVWVMNKGWYGKLSADQKKAVDSHCSNEWAAKGGGAWGDAEDAGREKLAAAAGHTIVKLTPEQATAWRVAADPVYAQWAAAVDKAGGKSKDILDDLKAELKKRNALQ
jgi:TRAP-type C4-dicarboxylate transport system substrate-binding protein